jgi:hypothetical protein
VRSNVRRRSRIEGDKHADQDKRFVPLTAYAPVLTNLNTTRPPTGRATPIRVTRVDALSVYLRDTCVTDVPAWVSAQARPNYTPA